jgi:phosphoglucosamine mutase
MSSRRLFGTDGVRGVANVEPMTPETVTRLGRAAATLCARQGVRRMVIGRDTRLSGTMLEAALAAGVAAAGADVLLAGEIPTPAVAVLARHEAAAGAVVSASHNPFADNGVKFFGADGFKLSDQSERDIEEQMGALRAAPPTGTAIGRICPLADAASRYKQFLFESLPKGFKLDGMRVVIDCANGAAHGVGPELFEQLGADVVALANAPDGVNINRDCGALHPEHVQAAVRDHGAELGIALDGDADRVMLVDRQGALVDGDEILAILVESQRRRGAPPAVVVGTVMSNLGLEIALRERGVQLLRAAVGDRYVVDEMRRAGALLGGEASGHIVMLEKHSTGDGLLAALAVCREMRECKRDLAALRGVMSRFPQVLLNVRVTGRRELAEIAPLQKAIAGVERALDGRGRVLVRFSGTEPLVRVMVEGEDERSVRRHAAAIAAVIERELKT